MSEERTLKTQKYIEYLSLDELKFLHTAYSPRDRRLMAYRKFNFYMDFELLAETIEEKELEQILLGGSDVP